METSDESVGDGGESESFLMVEDERIGARIAVQRRLRGLAQHELAARASVSLSLLRKIEQGSRPATARVVVAVAGALRVDRTLLTGQPYRTGDRREDAMHGSVATIRRELAAYQRSPQEDRQVPAITELRAMTNEVSLLRHRVDLTGTGVRLPQALADLRMAAHTYRGPDRERVMALLAEVYYATRQFLHKLGYLDLASLVADRYEWAAGQCGDPCVMALAEVFRAGELDSAGDWNGAQAVMADAVGSFDLTGSPQPTTLSVWGFLHLMSAYMCAHAGDDATTWAHYAQAEETARHLGADRDDYRLAFGPTNVAIWGTALAVELMDGAKAVALAQRVQLPGDTPPERAGHHFLDLARGQLLRHKPADALESLLAARQIAPQQIRYHPLARETVYALARVERRSSETLRGLAAWIGIPD